MRTLKTHVFRVPVGGVNMRFGDHVDITDYPTGVAPAVPSLNVIPAGLYDISITSLTDTLAYGLRIQQNGESHDYVEQYWVFTGMLAQNFYQPVKLRMWLDRDMVGFIISGGESICVFTELCLTEVS